MGEGSNADGDDRDDREDREDREAARERLAELFDTHFDRLYRVARRLVSNADDALDLVQEAFLRAARASGSIPLAAHESEAWLVRVLVNVRRDQWRKEAVRRRHDVLLRDDPTQVTGNQEEGYVTRTTVWRALDTLAPRRRAVIVMHEIEGLDPRAIAHLLGISVVTVRWHLSLGRRELARQLTSITGANHGKPRSPVAAVRSASSRDRSS